MNNNFLVSYDSPKKGGALISRIEGSYPSLSELAAKRDYSESTFSVSVERSSLVNAFESMPEIRLSPNLSNAVAVSPATNTEIGNRQALTRGPMRMPEVVLPQEIIANRHSVNDLGSDAVVIQIWEGRVQGVNHSDNTMRALLSAKMGKVPEHVATIDLQWVPSQDWDLVKDGSVFYLTLFKRVKRGGSIENSQEIRFRRRPNWSKSQIAKVHARADKLLSKIKSKPLLD